jgi:type I restriction enzyme M protein
VSAPKRISQSELEAYLWGAATLLRGTIDAGEYKSFIFPLLFLKRLSDVYDEEYAQALSESGGDAAYATLPEQHRFQIPDGAHWADLRRAVSDVGRAITTATREIERANHRLDGVFGDAPWTNKERLPDATLKELLEHYTKVSLSLANVPEDELGVGYEYLIKKFADDSGHTAAEFYTNRTLVHLMTQLLEIRPGDSVYDPTCGSGGMLLSAADELRRQGREHRTLRLYGQELNLTTSAIARMNLFLHGIEDFNVVRGDTLSNPAFTDGDRLRRFDVVLANPPYSIKSWDRAAWSSDRWGRNRYGTPPQGRADYAFWQHILASMDPTRGRCAILFPHGVLFRDEERDMRRKIVEADVIEAVIGLGPNLFYNSPMEACIVVCRSRKPPGRAGKVLMIDAVHEVTRERAQSFLSSDHVARIVAAYRAYRDEEGFATIVATDAIAARGDNLSIPLYVRRASGSRTEDLVQVVDAWRQSATDLRVEAEDLLELLEAGANSDG